MFAASEYRHHYTNSVFNYEEPLSQDYRVYINGVEAPVYTCRISAYPFNRVWTGFQRPIDQTELASFVNIVSDEDVTIEVEIERSFKNLLLKPYSKGVLPEVHGSRARFTLKDSGGYVLETDNYHHCLYIFNSRPIVCDDPGSVTHYFGPGVHFPGKITLHDNESVYLDKDALVFGCIFAENAKNIRIYGNGLLDDSGEERFCSHCYEAYANGNLKFYDCEDLKIEGVLLRNSAIWCINLFHCFHAELDGVKVFGQWRYNTDGADIVNSQDITIRNSFIHSFDDTITVKGIDRYINTDNRDMLFENCVLWCDWGRTCEIGIETACREYSNIVFRDCDILRGGSVALDIQNGDCAEVHDIRFENIRVEFNSFDTPEVYQRTDDMVYNAKDAVHIPHLIKIANKRFRNQHNAELWGVPLDLTAFVDLAGIKSGCVHDVTIKNIHVYYDTDIPASDGRYKVPVDITSSMEGVEFYNIGISNITLTPMKNGKQTGKRELLEIIP